MTIMIYRLLVDLVVTVHFLFIVFVIVGGLLCLVWPRIGFLHLPSLVWGFLITQFQWVCPLTPLELHLRDRAGMDLYEGGFIDQYIVPVIYTPGLTPDLHMVLGMVLLAGNVVVYGFVFRRHGITPFLPQSLREVESR